MQEILIRPIAETRIAEADFGNLEFGKYVSDHMFMCDFENGDWQQPRIIPFGDITLSPTALVFHYGQSLFEGMKAFRMDGDKICLFRPKKHYERLVKSMERMCIPLISEELFVKGLEELLRIDESWIPANEGAALYIRPMVFATEARFGVKVSNEYKFIIFTGPTGAFFAKPLRLKVESKYVRAAPGGTGYAKCSGNYGGAFYPTQVAKSEGFDQVLWTDACEHEYIEESGMMNAFFVLNNTLVTPPLSDSILDGITRDSLLQLARDMRIPTEERPVSLTELEAAFDNGTIQEAFGAGTAAVVSPIETINIHGHDRQLPEYGPGAIMFRLKNRLEAIRSGMEEDRHGWNHIVQL
ncbi:MAG TPA: branched-chain amino acid aminotransferase [Flavitalea sp.]|nr:branched-chain amino acid aminotransferase [Flavitalea sp.]